MNQLPTNNFFTDGIYIVLGLKDKDGKFYLYSNFKVKEIDINKTISTPNFAPFPYDIFTSLDDDFIEGYEKTYFKVQLIDNLTEYQINNLSSKGISYYHFGEKDLIVLEEFKQPFQYALNYLKSREGDFGYYNLTTWLIHDKTRGKQEKEAMEEILTLAYDFYKSYGRYRRSYIDISLDKNTLPYVSYLRQLDNGQGIISFGSYGRHTLTKEDILESNNKDYLNEDDILYLIDKTYIGHIFFHHRLFTLDFYKNRIENTKYEDKLVNYINRKMLCQVKESGFDFNYFVEKCILAWLKQPANDMNNLYETKLDLMKDKNYKPVVETYDPYEFYCCPECDGYELEEAETYDYLVDEQEQMFHEFVEIFYNFIDNNHLYLFEGWSGRLF